MKIVKLELEAAAPVEADCIKVLPTHDGQFRFVSSALFDGDSDGDESVAIVGGDTYASAEEAEAAGITWADEQGVRTLYVETSDVAEN